MEQKIRYRDLSGALKFAVWLAYVAGIWIIIGSVFAFMEGFYLG